MIYGPAYFNADLGIFKNFKVTEKKKLQLRANAYNFLNHPLWSFSNGANLNLGFNGTTGALNTPLFGYVTQKQGRRLVQPDRLLQDLFRGVRLCCGGEGKKRETAKKKGHLIRDGPMVTQHA